jgi:hypothetical protein
VYIWKFLRRTVPLIAVATVTESPAFAKNPATTNALPVLGIWKDQVKVVQSFEDKPWKTTLSVQWVSSREANAIEVLVPAFNSKDMYTISPGV